MSSPAAQPRSAPLRNRVPRIAQEAVDRARLSVVPRMRTRAPRVPFVMLVSMVLVSGVVGLLLFNTSMQEASFSAARLEAKADALSAREQTLRMELDQLRNPQRVATQAQRMGMVIPVAPVFLDLDNGRVSGERLPATRENALRLAPKSAVKPAVLDPKPTIVTVPPAVDPAVAAAADTTKSKAKNKSRNQVRNKARKSRR